MKATGFVASNTDAIIQGIMLLYKQFKEIGKGVAVTG
jgi:hypothetical protein